MRKSTLALALLIAGTASQAQAHKLKLFVTATGSELSGYGYFVPGGRAQDSSVTVTRADGSVVETLRTDDQGEFHFRAKAAEDYSFLIDAGDGHEAIYRVAAAEIGAPATTSAPAAAPQASNAPTAQALTASDIAPIVEQAVAKQLRPLREQMDGWQEKIWLHDVLGGIGYIIGLAGLLYGLTGTRRARDADAAIRQMKDARQ